MKNLTKHAAAACALAGALVAAPAAAQVSGNIGVASEVGAIMNSTAFSTAYQQIGTTYATQAQTIQTRQQERQTLLQQLDTNSDGSLDQAEQQAAQSTPQWTRLTAIDQEVQGLAAQIEAARIYSIEQLSQQFGPALRQVVTQDNLQMVFSPDAMVYLAPAANVTPKVTTAINSLAPSVAITPPQGWQPRRSSVELYQQIQQILVIAQAQQQAAQQQQQQEAPSGR